MQKIRNSEEVTIAGIKYKSKLEAYSHAILTSSFENVEYEPQTYLLFEGFSPSNIEVLYGPKSKTNRKEFVDKKKKQQSITYTPDFRVTIGNRVFIIETKGFPNDSFPMKKKMFLNVLNNLNDGKIYSYLEPTNQRQVRECITLIQELCQS